jgi:hypothetical protein
MRGIALLSLAALAACASGSSSTSTSRPETMRVVGGGGLATGGISMNASSTASVSKVAFPLDAVWRALPSVYDSLKIPPTTLDPKTHHFGNEGMKIRQRLGGVQLSKYIDCGQAQIGPSADSYDVFLNVTTTLRAANAGETEVSTMVEAAARPQNFGQDYTRCTSRGTLENAIAAIVATKLAAR